MIPIKSDDEEFSGNIIAVGRNKVNVNANLGFDKLEREGFLTSERIGNEVIYKNVQLSNIFK